MTPWFGQPGFGTQLQLPDTVGQLLEIGVLLEADVEERCNTEGVDEAWTWTNHDGAMDTASGVVFD